MLLLLLLMLLIECAINCYLVVVNTHNHNRIHDERYFLAVRVKTGDKISRQILSLEKVKGRENGKENEMLISKMAPNEIKMAPMILKTVLPMKFKMAPLKFKMAPIRDNMLTIPLGSFSLLFMKDKFGVKVVLLAS